MKINRREIMKRAHEIAKTLVGDWYARLALALRQAWREAKNIVEAINIRINGLTIGVVVKNGTSALKAEGYQRSGSDWYKEVTLENAETELRKVLEMKFLASFGTLKGKYCLGLAEYGKKASMEIGKKFHDIAQRVKGLA